MKFNTKTRYAIRAMVEIAKADQEKGIFQKDISKNQEISLKYLDHIIQSLKVAGLIVNVKGKKSGYKLTRPAEKITVLDIHTAFEPEIAIIDCLSEFIDCDFQAKCYTLNFWERLNTLIKNYLLGATLEDLVNKKDFTDFIPQESSA